MSAGKLATFVHVNGSVYGPDDDVPADVAALISNPKAWAEQPAGAQQKAGAGSESEIPPKGGAGSGAEHWRAYAAKVDVEIADDASREDVIAALEAAGKPTEAAPAE